MLSKVLLRFLVGIFNERLKTKNVDNIKKLKNIKKNVY